MKLEIKNLYGIREQKINLNSDDKKNIILFAPNGIGKTSIFKGFKDVIDFSEYSGLEKNINPIFNFSLDKIKLSYNEKINVGNITLLNHKTYNIDENNLLNIIQSSEKILEEEINKKIKVFHEKIQKLFNDSFEEFLDNQSWDVRTIIQKYTYYLKKPIIRKLDKIKKNIDSYSLILKRIEKLVNSGGNIKTIGEYYTLNNISEIGSEKNDILLNIQIINDIKKKKPETANDFGYWINEKEKYIGLSKLDQKFFNFYINKYTKDEINLIIALRKMDINIIDTNKGGGFNKNKGKLKTFKKKINSKINDLKKEKFTFILQNNEKEFLKIKNQFDKKTSRLLKKTNEKISILNQFLNSELLDWRIELLELKSLNEDIKFQIKNNESENFEIQNFDEYASDGQKKILSLIVGLIPFYNKSGVIIMDDVMSSLDNQHANEFFDLLSHDSFKKNHFFIMTHNFEWLRSMAFNYKLAKTSKFMILDKISENKYKLVEGEWTRIQDILNTKNLLIEETIKNLVKLVSISSIARETFANILISSDFPIKGLFKEKANNVKETKEDIQKQINKLSLSKKKLLNVIEFFDQYIRHYKGNITNVSLSKKFDEKIDGQLLSQLPILQEIKKLIVNISQQEECVFGDILIKENIAWEDITTFEEYVLLKIFFGIQARFKLEYKKYYESNNEKARKLWEDEEEWSKANDELLEENKKINNFKINYLAHANNIQWSKIVEFPIYKLEKLKNFES